jgi:3-hydroxy-9,10-secoandrosta-1,3,5(10)-triene-9,17-dione monooxygenase reductase component
MALATPAPAAPTPDPRSFRDALGRFATGVAFITAAPEGEPAGLIVNSLASVSLEPPLVSFSPSRSSLTWSRMRRAGRFGVNVLGRQHEQFAIHATPAGADRFAGLDWKLGRSGVPLLTDALASLECEIVAEHPAGDHWIVVGQVQNLRITSVEHPLIFFAGAFRALRQPARDHRRGRPKTAPLPRKGAPLLGGPRLSHRTSHRSAAAAGIDFCALR